MADTTTLTSSAAPAKTEPEDTNATTTTTSSTATMKRQNPLELAEIRSQISRFLDVKEALACSNVSNAWSVDFAGQIWHTVDMKEQARFKELDPKIISQKGHLIRVIHNIRRRSEINLFRHPSVKNLVALTLQLKDKPGFHKLTRQLIRRNMYTLLKLDLAGDDTRTVRTDFMLEHTLMPSSDALYQPILTKLVIRCLNLTRQSFSNILRGLPALRDLDVRACDFTDNFEVELYKHEGLTTLALSIEQCFDPSPDTSNNNNNGNINNNNNNNNHPVVPLLVHFPNIQCWKVWSSKNLLDDPTPETIGAKVREYCPKIEEVAIMDSSSKIVNSLLIRSFELQKAISIYYEHIAPPVVLGILHHKDTLTSLKAFEPADNAWSYQLDRVWPVEDSFSDAWMVQLMLSSCPYLTTVEIPGHELDMEHAEHFPWICTELTTLKIRVRGLNTEKLIMAAINKWRKACRERDYPELVREENEQREREQKEKELEQKLKQKEKEKAREDDILATTEDNNATTATAEVSDSANVLGITVHAEKPQEDTISAIDASAVHPVTTVLSSEDRQQEGEDHTDVTIANNSNINGNVALATEPTSNDSTSSITVPTSAVASSDDTTATTSTETTDISTASNSVSTTTTTPETIRNGDELVPTIAGENAIYTTEAIQVAEASSAAAEVVITITETAEPSLSTATEVATDVAATVNVEVEPVAENSSSEQAEQASLQDQADQANQAEQTVEDLEIQQALEAFRLMEEGGTEGGIEGGDRQDSTEAKEEPVVKVEEPEVDDPLVDKVVTHLLQFEKLSTLWLGYKVWTI